MSYLFAILFEKKTLQTVVKQQLKVIKVNDLNIRRSYVSLGHCY